MRLSLIRGLATSSMLWLASAAAAWCHGGQEAEELGHHWDVPVYLNEIHFQLVAMAVITAAVLLGRVCVRMWRRVQRQ